MINYTNSPLVDVVLLSPNYSEGRVHSTLNPLGAIDTITLHHMAGKLTVETCGRVFRGSRKASSNYGVGSDGRIALYVEEKNRAWTSSSKANDIRAVTIEIANDEIGGNWHVSDAALEATIKLCIDICKRNNIKKINFTGDKSGNLTMHKFFVATVCPGPYLESKFPYIADQINEGLNVVSDDVESEVRVPTKIAGKVLNLTNCNLYAASTSSRRSSTVTGTYFVWSDEIVSNRVRITNTASRVGVKGQVTGWVNYSSIEDQLADKVEESVSPDPVPAPSEPAPKDPSPEVVKICKGDVVKINPGSYYYKSKSKVPDWVLKKEWIVEVDPKGGSRVVIDESTDGQNSINSAVDLKDLTVVMTSKKYNSQFEKGDTVKIKTCARKWSTGENIPSWVKSRILYVRSTPSDGKCQVSTLKTGRITGVVEIRFLKKV